MTSVLPPRQLPVEAAPRFRRRSLWRRMPLRSRIALTIVIALAALAAAAPLLPIADPLTGELSRRLLPLFTDGHVLGTDTQGRDMLSRLLSGIRTSLVAGVVPIVIATVLGLAIGTIAGLANKTVNTVLMRGVDLLFAFPGVLLALLLAISLGVGLGTLILALTLVWIAPVARIAETEVARVRDLDFVTAARSSGASDATILVRQIIPVALPAVLAYSTSLVGANVAIAGGLGFIGLGVPSPQPELGSILFEMQAAIYTDIALALEPVVVILALSMLFPLIGDGLRDAIAGKGALS
ncbi:MULTISPECIES: ABC transporter permease [Microbacterium]|uniref:ABC transporter permease n=1 Tax=Microbacterium TaxID=33882 RepID=UPI0027826C57|nr:MULTISPECIES: ABC transporter permease [Microbacterium]MDQ1083712.1 peptide/nickel transport system permease protein [Microbacterium sp. SORGH_AS_0344]MDQ1171011.1 peptide/nickel transport system permease protein [Microbacterium proteolyticum]